MLKIPCRLRRLALARQCQTSMARLSQILAAVERQGCSTIWCCTKTDARVLQHLSRSPRTTAIHRRLLSLHTYGMEQPPQDGSTHGSNGPRWRSNARRTWALICVCETYTRLAPVPRDGPDRTGLHMTQNTVRPTCRTWTFSQHSHCGNHPRLRRRVDLPERHWPLMGQHEIPGQSPQDGSDITLGTPYVCSMNAVAQ